MEKQLLVRTDETTLDVPEHLEPTLEPRAGRGRLLLALATVAAAALVALILVSEQPPSAPVTEPASVADERAAIQDEKRLLLRNRAPAPRDEAAVLQAEKEILRSHGS